MTNSGCFHIRGAQMPVLGNWPVLGGRSGYRSISVLRGIAGAHNAGPDVPVLSRKRQPSSPVRVAIYRAKPRILFAHG
jgi:hypothetical protein